MNNFDLEKILNLTNGIALIISALIGGTIGFLAQLRLKYLDKILAERKEREKQRLKFYIPLLRCLYELDDRFKRILNNLDKNWLNHDHLDKIKNKEGFANNPNETGYFIISSIYLIGSFFGLTEAIKKGVDTTKLSYDNSRFKRIRKLLHKIKRWISKLFGIKKKLNIFQFDPDITKVFRLFQYEELFDEYMATTELIEPKDACKFHKHIQHSIGEMMLEKDSTDNYRVKSFREFYEAYVFDDKFRFWFVLIENLFVDLSQFPKEKSIEAKVKIKKDIRPLRILAIQYWCRMLMQKISLELDLDKLNLETKPPSDIIENLSKELRDTITLFELENIQQYISGLRISNK